MNGHALKLAAAFGYLHPWEVHALQVAVQDAIQGAAPGKAMIVNVGAGAGTSGLAIVEAGADPRFTWTVDISPTGPLGGLENERIAFQNAGLPVYPNQILGDSKEIGRSWTGGPLDLVFIDGDHSPAGVQGDIKVWLPLIKRGGWILFHDYHSNNWPAVVEAVDRMLASYPIAFSLDTLHARRIP